MIEQEALERSLIEVLQERSTSVQPDDTMAEAGRKILLADFVSMLKREQGSRSGASTEDLHQMRVATRRMRSVFQLLEPYFKTKPIRPYKKALKQIADKLGAVRDLDVMIEDLEAHKTTLDEKQQPLLQPIIDQLNARRVEARAHLIEMLDSSTYQQFIETFARFLMEPGKAARDIENGNQVVPHQVRHVLPVIIHEHLALVRAYDTVLENSSIDNLHALRIEFKRLRYIITLFSNVLGSSSKAFVTDLKTIQDHLGRLNDASVAIERLQTTLNEQKVSKKQKALIRGYIQELESIQSRRQKEFPPIWRNFNKREVQTKLANALLTLR